MPSSAVIFLGGQSNALDLIVKLVRTPVLLGPSDDRFTEILRRQGRVEQVEDWINFDGNEELSPATGKGSTRSAR